MFEFIKTFSSSLIFLSLIASVIFINDINNLKNIIRYNIETDTKFSDFNTMFKYKFKKKLIEYSIITFFLSIIFTYIFS